MDALDSILASPSSAVPLSNSTSPLLTFTVPEALVVLSHFSSLRLFPSKSSKKMKVLSPSPAYQPDEGLSGLVCQPFPVAEELP